MFWQVSQGDVLRYMLLHKYGGLYLDLDVECLAPADESLGDNTIILQGTGGEGITNAVLASAPNNTFWLEVLHVCQDRAAEGQTYPIGATGPAVIGEVIKRIFNIDPWCNLGFMGKTLEVCIIGRAA